MNAWKKRWPPLGRSDVRVDMWLLTTPSDIAGSGFAGLPTITIDGADIFPAGPAAGELSCRGYPNTPWPLLHGDSLAPGQAQLSGAC